MESLREALRRRRRRHMPGRRRAAVLVPLIDVPGAPRELLLTRRTEHLPTHKGHVAFPGGGIDPTDADVVDAALREAEEEVALPRDRVDVLGLLDDFPTVTGKIIVTPVVARVADLPELVPEPAEVARIFTIPLARLRDPAGWRVRHTPHAGRTWPVFYFDYDEETLWGLSAYITLALLELTPGGAPFEVPAL